MSFQKAHNVSNQLGEVLISTPLVDTTSMGTTAVYFEPSTAVAGKNYRVLEIGYTIITAGTNAARDTDFVDVGIEGATNSLVLSGDLPPAAGAPAKTTISTSSPGSVTFEFQAISTTGTPTSVDQDGVPQIVSGELMVVAPKGNVTDGPKVVFYAKLAPNVEYKF